MAFTMQELENIAAQTIDFHIRGKIFSQTIQDKPLYKKLVEGQKIFPGGKDNITWRVKGAYSSSIEGYEDDDQVGYVNPANVKQAEVPWKLVHLGIKFTDHELNKNGIVIVDSTTGKDSRVVSQAEKVQLSNILEDKVEDMVEGWARSFNSACWDDGVANPKIFAGIRSFILDDPTAAGSTFGIDRVTNVWWRNYSNVAINTAGSDAIATALQAGVRQQRRYGGKPNCGFAGSAFLEAAETEMRERGYYTQDGFAKGGDMAVGDLLFKGIPIMYDPTLDDRSESKYCYMLDTRTINLRCLDGEDRKQHNPARPEDRYVFYRAVTWKGAMTCSNLNANGVYAIL